MQSLLQSLNSSMPLVIFRSKAAADITMFAENARRIFEIIGRPESARGVITTEQTARRAAAPDCGG